MAGSPLFKKDTSHMNNTINETGPGLEPSTVADTEKFDPRATHRTVYVPQEGVTVGNFKNHPAYQPTKSHMERVAEHLTPGPLTDLVLACHGASYAGGWWTDLRTGKPLERNGAELLMLTVSELSEAAEGEDHDLMDDKLPHRQMGEVEIADFEIRAYDFCGGFRLDLQRAYERSEAFEPLLTVVHPVPSTPPLWRMARHISDGMEALRKGKNEVLVLSIARALRLGHWYADLRGYDVPAARVEKMAYNAKRADHKPEARLADGGKKF